MKNLNSITGLALLCLFIGNCFGISVEEDLTITNDQKIILDKFRNLMSSRLPHAYMVQDIYLIRWLRASNFDINEAEFKLVENLQWRKDNKMDTIVFEDWSNFEKQYPYFLEGCDIDGRPVASAYVGDWDVRKAMISGQRTKMDRYSYKLLEEIVVLIRLAQEEGKNVTQFGIIVNMNNFNMVQNGCPQCIPYYISMLASYELHYPGSVHKAILVNTPPVFQTLLNTLLPFVPKATRDLLYVYGKDKKSWQPKISNDIPKDQLTLEFGGTKDMAFTPDFLRKIRQLPC